MMIDEELDAQPELDLGDIEIVDALPEPEPEPEPATQPEPQHDALDTYRDSQPQPQAWQQPEPPKEEELPEWDIEGRAAQIARQEAREAARQEALAANAPVYRSLLLDKARRITDDPALNQTIQREIQTLHPEALAQIANNPQILEDRIYAELYRRQAAQKVIKPNTSIAPTPTQATGRQIALRPEDRADWENQLALLNGLPKERIDRVKRDFLKERGYL